MLGGTVLLALYVASVLGAVDERALDDETVSHLPTIEQFSREIPHPNLADYQTATSPGYHLVLAALHKYVSQDVEVLRACGAVYTVLLLGVLGWGLGRGTPWRVAVAVGLPTVASLYVFVSGAWLLPDNLAWLTVLLAVLMAFRGRVDFRAHLAAAAVLALAVFVRQTNIWVLGALAAGAALAHDPGDTHEDRLSPPLQTGWLNRAGSMLLTGIPAAIILAWLAHLWHGLTPPAFQTFHGPLPPGHSGWQHEGPNFAVPAMVLAVLGTTGVFYAGFAWQSLRDALLGRERRARAILLAGLILGGMTAVVVQTSWNPTLGRTSGLWNIARVWPAFHERSVLVLALAAAGGATTALWFLALGRRDRWIWLATWVCFIISQTANAMAWQRYYEPFCLMILALAVGRMGVRRPTPRWALAGPLVLAALLAAVTVLRLRPHG